MNQLVKLGLVTDAQEAEAAERATTIDEYAQQLLTAALGLDWSSMDHRAFVVELWHQVSTQHHDTQEFDFLRTLLPQAPSMTVEQAVQVADAFFTAWSHNYPKQIPTRLARAANRISGGLGNAERAAGCEAHAKKDAKTLKRWQALGGNQGSRVVSVVARENNETPQNTQKRLDRQQELERFQETQRRIEALRVTPIQKETS